MIMKFTIQKDRLVEGVQDVLKAVSSRTTIPILTGIKIVASDEGVSLTGSDSDISIESFIPKEDGDLEIVTIEQPGSIVLQARFSVKLSKSCRCQRWKSRFKINT